MAEDRRDAVDKVLDTTELLEMVLSHLSIKPLVRARRVSKTWNAAISSSPPRLRQNLFLEPAPVKAHLEWKIGVDTKYYNQPPDNPPFGQSRYRPVIVLQASDISKIVVEPHPVIRVHMVVKTYIESRWIDYNTCKKMSPSTLLFQPPLEEVELHIEYGSVSIIVLRCPKGVTFGAVCQELDKLGIQDPESDMGRRIKSGREERLRLHECRYPLYFREEKQEHEAAYRQKKEQFERICIKIIAKGVVAEGSDGVVEAQQAFAREEKAKAEANRLVK